MYRYSSASEHRYACVMEINYPYYTSHAPGLGETLMSRMQLAQSTVPGLSYREIESHRWTKDSRHYSLTPLSMQSKFFARA